MKLGIVGNGFVGGAILNAFKNNEEISLFIYDKDIQKSKNSLQETLESDLIFVCLPTPMKRAEGDEANLSIIYSFFEEANKFNPKGILVIKSTVPVGTTKDIQNKYKNLKIAHNPEFLTARFANSDFINAKRHIIGSNEENCKIIKSFYLQHFPKVPVFTMSSDESELSKYAANCFFATKVAFFNEIKLFSEEINADYAKIIEAVSTDDRIEASHTQVPGHDGQYGFGGYCFPKDINAFIRTLNKSKKASGEVLKCIWERNKKIRKVWDWQNSKSSIDESE